MPRQTPPGALADVSSRSIKEMRDFVDNNSTFASLPLVSAIAPVTSPGHVVFLSGTTGSLGSYLLNRLLLDEAVAKIYPFNRRGPTSVSMPERHAEIFIEKGLDPSVLHAQRHKYELLEGDLTKENFGLAEQQFLEMAASVTIIVHNASPHRPAFLFSSSLAKLQNAPTSLTPHKEAPIPPKWSASTGYSKSKWVAAQLLARATESGGLRTLSVRVGQLCGGDNGSWRAEEWFPS
ncbi:hypothetical protein BKA70DRAFT_1228510 [Coprinopsis sp. MPI-PUGE-AT-0042]|nr:hypothetical protein BKA70DRAFT_1228510 [Coprinopsis sp. MPI-PUGE-AT-0042]